MILLEYIEFENGSVQFSKEEFEKLLAEHKRNLHALWMARALRAEEHTYIHAPNREKWQWVERKCLDKAREFE